MSKTQSPRWTRVLNGWYSINLRTTAGYLSAEVMQNELGMWAVTVNNVSLGMTDSLKSAKSIALASA